MYCRKYEIVFNRDSGSHRQRPEGSWRWGWNVRRVEAGAACCCCCCCCPCSRCDGGTLCIRPCLRRVSHPASSHVAVSIVCSFLLHTSDDAAYSSDDSCCVRWCCWSPCSSLAATEVTSHHPLSDHLCLLTRLPPSLFFSRGILCLRPLVSLWTNL